MTAQKCVVEGCDLEYEVVCSFSFYNVNVGSESENLRQEWIEGAMHEESECLWRQVSLQLCGYHFELDSQGLWIDSPMLPELLTLHDQAGKPVQSEEDKRIAQIISMDHNYGAEPPKADNANVTRLNVRQLVDTLGYLSLKNLQRKQLWVVKVQTDSAEASITQTEQVITKMQDPKQIIEIIPQECSTSQIEEPAQNEVLQIMEDDSSVPENFIYEIAEEQEISMDEVKEIPGASKEWMVNIIPEPAKTKYAFVKHCPTRKKKRHFTCEMNQITLHGDYENYYILPDADPSVGVEITTSCEPETYIVQDYNQLLLEERPPKRSSKKSLDADGTKKRRKKPTTIVREEVQVQPDLGDDWTIETYEDGVSGRF